MKGILTDIHMGVSTEILIGKMQSETWLDLWNRLGLDLFQFEDLGLAAASTDREIWQRCQDDELIFITNNRNEDSADSLGTTIRLHGTLQSLPVFTIGDLDRFRKTKSYADEVVEQLYDYLLDIDRYRGAGRLYLP
ncbi:MAG: DUF5615 family PIN-like protein [Planctomycetes bacterium]|nr:DUF5615 family PIN-like protein [Planctomycetota bacterium]